MSQPNRGLNLSDVSAVTSQEREQFSALYRSVLGHTHRGLDYLLEEDRPALGAAAAGMRAGAGPAGARLDPSLYS